MLNESWLCIRNPISTAFGWRWSPRETPRVGACPHGQKQSISLEQDLTRDPKQNNQEGRPRLNPTAGWRCRRDRRTRECPSGCLHFSAPQQQPLRPMAGPVGTSARSTFPWAGLQTGDRGWASCPLGILWQSDVTTS